jgi:Fe-S-cluster containining protein
MSDDVIRYDARLQELRSRLPPSAHDLGVNYCTNCSFCCWGSPCKLVREDVFIISEYLKIDPYEFFRKYLTVYIVKSRHYVVTPIRHQQEKYAGKILPMKCNFDMESTCIFLDEETNKCKIHGIKPAGGKNAGCWKDNPPALEQYYWKRKDLKEFMAGK